MNGRTDMLHMLSFIFPCVVSLRHSPVWGNCLALRVVLKCVTNMTKCLLLLTLLPTALYAEIAVFSPSPAYFDTVAVKGSSLGKGKFARKIGGVWNEEQPVSVESIEGGLRLVFQRTRVVEAFKCEFDSAQAKVVAICPEDPMKMHTGVVTSGNSWMAGKVGVFAHYLPDRHCFEHNASFDVKGLVGQLREMRADYFIITLAQNNTYYCSPNEAYETIGKVPRHSRCSKRDIPAEIIAELKGTGVRFGLYLPCQPSRGDKMVVENFGLTMEDAGAGDHRITAQSATNWAKVIEEWSRRYGEDVSLWWFDGAYPRLGMNDAIAAQYKAACRVGNPNVQVTFNAGVRGFGSERRSDYWAGEENEPLSVVPSCRWRRENQQWHVLTYMGFTWGNRECRFRDDALRDWLQQVVCRGGMVTLDIQINYLTGRLDRAQVEQFSRVKP